MGEKIFDVLNTIFLLMLALLTLYPFWHVLLGSIMPYEDAVKNTIRIFPTRITFDAFAYVLSTAKLMQASWVSIYTTLITTVYQMFVTSMIACVLTKKELPGRNLIFTMILITMFFSGGLVPYYLLIKSLNLIDNILVLIIPYAVNTWWIFVLISFFKELPKELEESAKIDGAGYFRTYIQIIMPLSMPALATIGLFTAVSKWNDWFAPMLFLNNAKLWPLTLVLREIIVNSETDITKSISLNIDKYMSQENIKMAVIMISVLPIIIVYPFVQKHFVKGVLIGSVKN
jgi:putative aldouronate transport system permease protein